MSRGNHDDTVPMFSILSQCPTSLVGHIKGIMMRSKSENSQSVFTAQVPHSTTSSLILLTNSYIVHYPGRHN